MAHQDIATTLAEVNAPAVSFRGVGKRFDNGTVALEGVSFDIPRGHFVSIVGPSGCGKSTLLRLCSGLSTLSAGEVRVPDVAPGFVFQSANLLPWRSVLANVELIGELDGTTKDVRRQRALEVLAQVGLNGFERHLPIQLSGGMQMRVSIARALVSRPKVLLMDEPFGALDEITRFKMQEDLQTIIGTGEYTGMFITHSVSEAVFLSNKVVVMSARPGSVIAEVDIPHPHPRDGDFRFTAEFQRYSEQISDLLVEGTH